MFFVMCDRLWRGFAHRLNLGIFLKAIAKPGNPTPSPSPLARRGARVFLDGCYVMNFY
ncbi:hypothetical protein [Nodularia sphaerocarpa]|uniref:hypothetical protein n=1 Tax=Nodularia sphaerocarpa TaxID=137816 RepID=UPI001EFB5BA1|nr:hypothetical protein [Nodularia sphaerocarpa]